MVKYAQLTGTVPGPIGKFEQDKSNIIILALSYLTSSLMDQ